MTARMPISIYSLGLIAIIAAVSGQSSSPSSSPSTTAQVTGSRTTSAQDPLLTTLQQSGTTTVGVTDPCSTNYSISINTTGSNIDQYSRHNNCIGWPSQVWTRFIDVDEKPLDILMYSSSDMMCTEPHQCGSMFPWYLIAEAGFTLLSDRVIQVPLCMTDQTSRHTNLCCLSPIMLSMKKCTDGVRYYLHKEMPKSVCGNVCFSQNLNYEEPAKNWLSERYVTYTTHQTRQTLADLPREAKENIVTITIAINRASRDMFKEIEAVGRLRNALASKWSSNILARLRRRIRRSSSEGSHHQIIRESDIVAIHGSPYYDDGLVYYTFYVKNENNNVVSTDMVMPFLEREVQNFYILGDETLIVLNVSQGAATEIEELPEQHVLYTEAPPPETAQAVIQDTTQVAQPVHGGTDWVYIIIILTSAACMGILLILGTAIYINCFHKKSYNLRKNRESWNVDSPRVTLYWRKPAERDIRSRPQNGGPVITRLHREKRPTYYRPDSELGPLDNYGYNTADSL